MQLSEGCTVSGRVVGWVLQEGPRPDDIDRSGKPYGKPLAKSMRWVLVQLAEAGNNQAENCRPGLARLVDQSLMSRSRVLAMTKMLEDEGWIETISRAAPKRAMTFRICTDRRVLLEQQRVSSDDERVLFHEDRALYSFTNVETNASAASFAANGGSLPQEPLEPVDVGDFETLRQSLRRQHAAKG